MGSFQGFKPYKYLIHKMDIGGYGYPQDITDTIISGSIIGKDYICIDVSDGNISSPSSDDLMEEGGKSWIGGTAKKKIAHYNIDNSLTVNSSLSDLRFYLRSILQSEQTITPGPTGKDSIESVVWEAGKKTPLSFTTICGYYHGDTVDNQIINAREVVVYGHQLNTISLDGKSDDGLLSVDASSIYGQFDEHRPIRSSDDTNYIPSDEMGVLEWANIKSINIKQSNNECIAQGSLSQLAGDSSSIKISYNRNLEQTASKLGGGIFSSAKASGDDGYNVEIEITLNKSANQSSQLQEIFFAQVGATSFQKELQSGVFIELNLIDNFGGQCKLVYPNCSISLDSARSLGSDNEPTLKFTTNGAGSFDIVDSAGHTNTYNASSGAYFYIEEATESKLTCISLENTSNVNIELQVDRVNTGSTFWDRSWILKDIPRGDTFKFRLPKGEYNYWIRKAGSDPDVGPCQLVLDANSAASIILPLGACFASSKKK